MSVVEYTDLNIKVIAILLTVIFAIFIILILTMYAIIVLRRDFKMLKKFVIKDRHEHNIGSRTVLVSVPRMDKLFNVHGCKVFCILGRDLYKAETHENKLGILNQYIVNNSRITDIQPHEIQLFVDAMKKVSDN